MTMFFDIGDSSRTPVLEGGPKDPLGCRSFDQGSHLPPLPQRVPTLPLPPTRKFHLPGDRRHALVLYGCVKKPRTEKRFDRGPQRDHDSSGRGSPGAGYWQSHRPRKEPKPGRCAVRTLTTVDVEAKCDKSASVHKKRERFRLFWIRSQLLSPTPQQLPLISPTLAPPPPVPIEPPSALPCPGCSHDVTRIIAGLWSGGRRSPPALAWSQSLQPLPMHLALPTADMWHFEQDVGVEDALHPTLHTSVGNPRCVAFLWTLSRRSRNRLQHALNGNPPLRLRLRHKQPPTPYHRQGTLEPQEDGLCNPAGDADVLLGFLQHKVDVTLAEIGCLSDKYSPLGHRCALCPWRSFSRVPRLRRHIFEYHSNSRKFVASGVKQLRVTMSLFSVDKFTGILPGEYLRRSSDLLRGTVHPAPSPKVNSIENHLRLCLAGSGPVYLSAVELRRSPVHRRVGNLHYDRLFAERLLRQLLINGSRLQASLNVLVSPRTLGLRLLWFSGDRPFYEQMKRRHELQFLTGNGTMKVCFALRGKCDAKTVEEAYRQNGAAVLGAPLGKRDDGHHNQIDHVATHMAAMPMIKARHLEVAARIIAQQEGHPNGQKLRFATESSHKLAGARPPHDQGQENKGSAAQRSRTFVGKSCTPPKLSNMSSHSHQPCTLPLVVAATSASPFAIISGCWSLLPSLRKI